MLKTPLGQISILLILAGLFGGGGASYGLSNLVVQLTALAILAMSLEPVRHFFASAPRMVIALVLAALALPLIQLVPLPAAIWSGLPGRQLVAEAYGFAGGPTWSALTVSQARTFVAFVGLIAPFTVIALGWSLDHEERHRIVMVLIGLGVFNLVPGIAEALVATAIGLFAAIPAVVAYNRFAHDIDRVANKLETFIEEFSNILQRNLGAQSASGH